jgi:CheY-like chemotaxis protein
LKSELGAGTEFRVEFPQVMVSDELRGRTVSKTDHPEDLRGLTILVVDDEEDIRLVLQRLLTAQNAAVALAANGFEALELLRRMPFDVVLSDVKMSGLSGFHLFQEVSKLPRVPSFVLITAALDFSREQQELIQQHDLKVVRKPFNVEQVLATLRMVKRASRD